MSEARLKLAVDGVARVVSGMRRVRESVGEATSAIGGLSFVGGGLGTVLGALSAGSVAAFIKTQIDAADALTDLSKATNITVEDLSGLDWAAQLSGTTLDEVARGVNKLAVEMGKNSEKFAKLGVTAKEPIDAFLQLADVYNAIEDPQQRAAVANAALGQSYERLAPLLSEGSDNIRSMIERGRELSGITTEMADEAGKFNDQLDETRKRAAGAGIAIAKDLLPVLNDLFEDMRDGTKIAGGFWNALFTFGLSSPFGTASEQVAKYREELDEADKQIARIKRNSGDAGPDEQVLRGLEIERERVRMRLEMAQARQRREIDYSDENQTDAESRRLGLTQPPTSRTKPNTSGFLGANDEAAKKRDEAMKKSMDFMTQLEKEAALVGATTAQKKSYEAEEIASIMRKAGISKQAVDQFLENHARELAAYEAKRAAYERDEEIRKDMLRYSEELTNAGRTELETVVQQLQAERQRNEEIGLTSEALADLIAHRLENEAAANREQAANLRAAAIYAGPLHDAYLQYAADLEAAADAKDALADERRYGAGRQKFVDEQQKIADQAKQVWEEFGDNVQRNLGDNLYGAMRGEFDNIGDAWLSMIQRMVADAMAADLRSVLMGGSGGNMSALIGGFGNLLGGLFGGGTGVGIGEGLGGMSIVEAGRGFIGAGRASGGPVFRNTLHPVNERGPELLSIGGQDYLMMGNRSGHVTPNHKLGGGKSVLVTVNQNNKFESGYDRARLQGDMARLKEATRAEIMDELRREGVVA